MDLCGVDWPERSPRFEVVYNLLSVSLNHRLRVIVTAPTRWRRCLQRPSSIWPVATWWEREAWDLFGIVFSDQPDLAPHPHRLRVRVGIRCGRTSR